MNIKTITEDDLVVGLVEKTNALTVSIYLNATVCEQNGPTTTARLILFTELLLSGSKTYSRDEIQAKLRALGSSIDASYNSGKITLAISTLADKLKPTLELLKQILINPTFSIPELKRAKQTLINQLELAKEDARGLAHANLNNSFFNTKDNRYSYDPEALIQSVPSINQSELKKLHEIFLNRQWTITIGGNETSQSQTLQAIKKIKKGYKALIPEINNTSVALNDKPKLILHEVKSKQNLELSFGAYLPLDLRSPDLAAFQFGLAVLGKWGGFAGRLMSTVREKEGLTYGIYARTEEISLNQTGYWRIMSFFSPKDVKRGITSTLREINKIHANGITKSEWQRFSDILKTGERLTYDSLTSSTVLVHNNLLLGRNWLEYQDYRQRLYHCTLKEVNQALKKYLSPEKLLISIAGPIAKAKDDLATIF